MNELDTMQTYFQVLGDKTRYTLFSKMINECKSCVSELAEDLKISTAGTSQQLKILEEAGMLKRVRKGQRVCHEVNLDDPQVRKIANLIKAGGRE